MAHSSVVEDEHLDPAGLVAGSKVQQVLRMFWVWLECNRANLLELPLLWDSEVPLVEGQDWGEGEEVGLVQLPDLEASVGAKVQEDMEAAVQRVGLPLVFLGSVFYWSSRILQSVEQVQAMYLTMPGK